MTFLIISIVIAIITFVFVWRVLTPYTVDRLMEKRVTAYVDSSVDIILAKLKSYHEEEVAPLQEALAKYPKVISSIYGELDMLASEGQAPKLPAKPKLPTHQIKFVPDEFELEEKLPPHPALNNPNRKPLEDPIPHEGHCVLVGQNGCGKTNTMMVSLLSRMQAGHEVHLIDTKNELGQIFENHVSVYKPEDVVRVIRKFTQAAKDRMQFFADTGRQLKQPIRDIKEYREVTGKTMPTISIIIEELIVVTDAIDADELTELYVAGRASGIYIFALAQLLKADILPRKCSVNIMTKIFMGAPDKIAMRVLYPGGVPKHILSEAYQHLGPSGQALMYDGRVNEFKCIKFPRVDREMLVDLMQ